MPLFSIVNLIIFQVAWFSAALLRDDSVFILLSLLVLHWFLSPKKQADFCLTTLLLPVALTSELVMVFSGLIVYQSDLSVPIWMILLWCLLGVGFNHGLAWMQKIHVIWQSILGVLSGIGSYAAASNLGAIYLPNDPVISLLIIAVVWGIQVPLIIQMAYLVRRRRLICPALK